MLMVLKGDKSMPRTEEATIHQIMCPSCGTQNIIAIVFIKPTFGHAESQPFFECQNCHKRIPVLVVVREE